MLNSAQLKNALHGRGLTRKQQVLLCLAMDSSVPRTVAEIRSIAVGAGLSAAKRWNISALLISLTGCAIRVDEGWELSGLGMQEVANLTGAALVPQASSRLRLLLSHVGSADAQQFIEEAVGSVEAHHYRAAVVLTWVGAIAVLYDYVVRNKLSEFNTEARRRDARWKDAKTVDDLARVKEYDFLQVLEAISVVGKNVKNELEGCLKLRNACGHPNSLRIAEFRVNAHVETLLLNVFAPFT